jgi:hypothetical protein
MCWASSGVSPSAAEFGTARQVALGLGPAWSGQAWAAMAARRACEPSLPPSLVVKAGLGGAVHGMARRCTVRSVRAERGEPRQGSRTVARRLRPPCHPHKGWQATARRSWARFGWPRRGEAGQRTARAADSSTELPRRLPAALFGGQT